jgi:hypothetical protein
VFVAGKHFQPILMLVGKAGAYLIVEKIEMYFYLGWLLAFLTNIGQGWKGLLGTNTLAYYEYL